VDEPCGLPWCSYPTAAERSRHGFQPLPDVLPIVEFARAEPYRSRRFRAFPTERLVPTRVLEAARVVAASFARREPQCRHIRPPRRPPAALHAERHSDPFGCDVFGEWTSENILSWFVRLLILTDPSSPRSAIRVKHDALEQSLVIVDETGAVIGGALNETMAWGPALALREDDPFLSTALAFVEPVMELLGDQDAAALDALSEHDDGFRSALAQGRVGHHFMVARSDVLPTLDTFELVAATAEHYRELGFAFVIVEATNQWTGAACEVLNGTRVHFAPFRSRAVVQASAAPLEDRLTSPDGRLAAKDSGSMLYVLRLV
jgi:hypothetical protein